MCQSQCVFVCHSEYVQTSMVCLCIKVNFTKLNLNVYRCVKVSVSKRNVNVSLCVKVYVTKLQCQCVYVWRSVCPAPVSMCLYVSMYMSSSFNVNVSLYVKIIECVSFNVNVFLYVKIIECLSLMSMCLYVWRSVSKLQCHFVYVSRSVFPRFSVNVLLHGQCVQT